MLTSKQLARLVVANYVHAAAKSMISRATFAYIYAYMLNITLLLIMDIWL